MVKGSSTWQHVLLIGKPNGTFDTFTVDTVNVQIALPSKAPGKTHLTNIAVKACVHMSARGLSPIPQVLYLALPCRDGGWCYLRAHLRASSPNTSEEREPLLVSER